MPVQFKFRGEKAFRSLLNVTTPCTLQRVRNAIYEQARISDATTDLALEDSGTGGALDPRTLLVQDALVQVIVRRTPVQSRPTEQPAAAVQLDRTSSSTVLEAERSEEDLAIDRVVEQHDPAGMGIALASSSGALVRYSRSYRLAMGHRMRQREGYDVGSDEEDGVLEALEPPPANYTCHRCGQVGGKPESHWIWECPTNEDPDHMKKVRTAKGIPRDFLRKVASVEEGQELSAGGVTFTLPGHSGHYIFAHEATYEDKKLRVGDTVQEKVVTAFTEGAKKVEESLRCPLCHQMFRQATLSPCCGATFCSDCVIDRLAKSDSVENSRCPGCNKEVLAHQLIANEDIRKQVEQITKASKAMAIASHKERERPKAFEIDAALKDRVNRPRKHGSDEMLALTDSTPAESQQSVAYWHPLGFAPLLTAEQFAVWQHLARAGVPPAVRERFQEWQRQLRGAALPPPTKESFEEWQKMLREGKRPLPGPPGLSLPQGGDGAGGSGAASPGREHKRSRKEKKEKKEHRRERTLAAVPADAG
mmetsp:Transcript_103806/g.289118  ORF Transcript_103806/g.289118 Transcript_103806/m.289118 type:complete len:534 (+) Transcript_103806:107-1708(+)